MIGEENCKDIIAGYLQRRGMQGTLNDEGGFEDGMHVYVKPQASEIWSAGSKKIIKIFKPRVLESITSSSFPEALNGSELSGPSSSKGKSGGGKAKRTGKGISLAEAAEGKMIMSRGAPCTCLATRHKLVNNCLSCGRIVCEQEGEGPCNFCGALVLSEGSTYAGLEGSNVPMSDSEAAAQAFKDRLVEYGRTSSQRTTVIDDQSDYFQVDESTWLSEEVNFFFFVAKGRLSASLPYKKNASFYRKSKLLSSVKRRLNWQKRLARRKWSFPLIYWVAR